MDRYNIYLTSNYTKLRGNMNNDSKILEKLIKSVKKNSNLSGEAKLAITDVLSTLSVALCQCELESKSQVALKYVLIELNDIKVSLSK